jgi:tetratricopeptide (TPR) repeat protein
MPNLRVALAVVVVLLFAVVGCGGESASGGEDPASAVPRDAAMYFEATVRPEGSLREDALAAAGKVLRTDDPSGRIRELVDEAFASSEDPKLDYARDVEPWLGEKAGFWLSTSRSSEKATGVALLAATDEDEAQAAIDRAVAASDKRFSEREHDGVALKVNEEGIAVAVAEGFAMFGTEAELKRSIDAAKGDSLADADRYTDAIGELEEERLAHFFVDAKALFDQAVKADPDAAEQAEQLRRFFPIDQLGPITGAFTANGDRLALDAVTGAAGGELFKRFGVFTGTGSTPLLGELPADSWLALGSPKLGETAKALYDEFAGALGGAAIEQQLRQELGLDLQQDVFSWIGDVAFFVRGATEDAADGGAVISVTDQDRAAAAFGKLVGLLRTQGGVDARPTRIDGAETAFEVRRPDAPKPVVIARSDDRVVIAYGPQAAEAALSPDAKLADSESFGRAEELLGDDFDLSFLLSMDPIVSLVESSGEADAEFEKARPYIEAFSLLASGTKIDDDRARSRFVAGLK